MFGKKKNLRIEDAMIRQIGDRRLLSHVPDPSGQRRNNDRRDNRENDESRPQYARYAGRRFLISTDVLLHYAKEGQEKRTGVIRGQSVDVSQTGMCIDVPIETDLSVLSQGQKVDLDFRLKPGMMQEGTEKHYRIDAEVIRVWQDRHQVAVHFNETLYENRGKTVDTFLFTLSMAFLFMVALIILLMRVESIHNFRSNMVLYGYSIMAAVFLLTRYFFGMLYRPIPINPDYTPSVTVVIPCFNEETWIRRTILSCIDQDYPVDKLDIIIVDDGSTDKSAEVIEGTIEDLIRTESRYLIRERVRFFKQKYNQGKREAMGVGIRNGRTELIAFVDSDSFLEPDAIRNLVQPMQDPMMAGATGRTDVANTYTNHLTRMQSVRYYISFRVMKAAESYFDCVMCLSGPLSVYRIEAVREVFEEWLHQQFMGQKATFGDDRSLTNFVVKKHRTYYQDTAICNTIVPNRHKVFLRQQMRWKRSWLRESMKAGGFIWRKEPFMAISFYVGLLIPMVAPLIVIYNLFYIPLTRHVFPTTFLLGLLMMSLMMSFAQLIMKKSTLWAYGLLFCLYYECVLLWQMPWAWLTFWVSNWGTRGGGKQKEQKGKKKKKEIGKAKADVSEGGEGVVQKEA